MKKDEQNNEKSSNWPAPGWWTGLIFCSVEVHRGVITAVTEAMTNPNIRQVDDHGEAR